MARSTDTTSSWSGKKEKLIPYNTFTTHDYKICPIDRILTKFFPHPDCMRFELHRVWVVDAKLKPEFRHLYPMRHLYWDEDSYGGVAENYNKEGQLFRMVVALRFSLGEGGGACQGSRIMYSPQNGACRGSWIIQAAAFAPLRSSRTVTSPGIALG